MFKWLAQPSKMILFCAADVVSVPADTLSVLVDPTVMLDVAIVAPSIVPPSILAVVTVPRSVIVLDANEYVPAPKVPAAILDATIAALELILELESWTGVNVNKCVPIVGGVG